jgi:hypothetical protein
MSGIKGRPMNFQKIIFLTISIGVISNARAMKSLGQNAAAIEVVNQSTQPITIKFPKLDNKIDSVKPGDKKLLTETINKSALKDLNIIVFNASVNFNIRAYPYEGIYAFRQISPGEYGIAKEAHVYNSHFKKLSIVITPQNSIQLLAID